jgi:phosphoribosylanthranilate isomerase
MFVKVCGLKTKEHIDQAIEYGYDAIGVVTYPKSKRYCSPKLAMELARYAGNRIQRFVVGIRFSDVEAAAPAFDYTQIYEQRQVPNLVLASKEQPPSHLDFEYFVYDASIGSGVFKAFPNWLRTCSGRILVAGGLDADNVCEVVRDIRPFGIDVSSGVEKNGVKDPDLMKAFIDRVRACSKWR